MLALALLVLSIGFADSLNPSTVLPALYMSTTDRAVPRIASFALGVVAVSFLVGVVIVAGPGQLLIDVLGDVGKTVKHIVEVAVGVALLGLALGLWRAGDTLTDRIPRSSSGTRRSSFVLGAGIMLVELPTAFPYFAALAAIIGSGANLVAQLGYVALFNFMFVLPVLAILVLRMVASEGARRRLVNLGDWVRRYANTAVAVVALLAGVGFLIVGLAGLL